MEHTIPSLNSELAVLCKRYPSGRIDPTLCDFQGVERGKLGRRRSGKGLSDEAY